LLFFILDTCIRNNSMDYIEIFFIVLGIIIITLSYLLYIEKQKATKAEQEKKKKEDSDPKQLRIMTWNSEWVSSEEKAHVMKKTKDYVLDAIKNVCNIISKNNPDVAILNEISDVPTLRIMADYLLQKFRIKYNIYMFENRKRPEHKQFSGVFIKEELDPQKKIDIIPVYSWYRNFHFVINLDETRIRIFSVHLKADGPESNKQHIRRAQLQDVVRLALDARERGENVVIMGDFNETYGTMLYEELTKKGFVNAMFTGRSPRNPYRAFTQWSDLNDDNLMQSNEIRDLDHVFVDTDLYRSLVTVYIDRFTAQKVGENDPTSKISDHWPLIVEFSSVDLRNITTSTYQAEFGTKRKKQN
jgi:exonuclease III